MKKLLVSLASLAASSNPLLVQHAEILESFYGGTIKYKTPTHMCVPKYLDGLIATVAVSLQDRCSIGTKAFIISGLDRFGKDVLHQVDSDLEIERICFEIESINRRISDFSDFGQYPINRSIYMEFARGGYKILSIANVNIMPYIFPGKVGTYLANILDISAGIRDDKLTSLLLRHRYSEEILQNISDLLSTMMNRWHDYLIAFPDFFIHYSPLDFFKRRLTEPRFPAMDIAQIEKHREHIELIPIEIELQRVIYRHKFSAARQILEGFHEVLAVHRDEMGDEMVETSIRAADLLISAERRLINLHFLEQIARAWSFCVGNVILSTRVLKDLAQFMGQIEDGSQLRDFDDDDMTPWEAQVQATFGAENSFNGIRLRNVLKLGIQNLGINDHVRYAVLSAYENVFKQERYPVKVSELVWFANRYLGYKDGYATREFYHFYKTFRYSIFEHITPWDLRFSTDKYKLMTIKRLIPLWVRIDDECDDVFWAIKSYTGPQLELLAQSIETYLSEKDYWYSQGSMIGQFPVDIPVRFFGKPEINIGLFVDFVARFREEMELYKLGVTFTGRRVGHRPKAIVGEFALPNVIHDSKDFEILRRIEIFPRLEQLARNGRPIDCEHLSRLIAEVFRACSSLTFLNKGKTESVKVLENIKTEIKRIVSKNIPVNQSDPIKALLEDTRTWLLSILHGGSELPIPSLLRIIDRLKQL